MEDILTFFEKVIRIRVLRGENSPWHPRNARRLDVPPVTYRAKESRIIDFLDDILMEASGEELAVNMTIGREAGLFGEFGLTVWDSKEPEVASVNYDLSSFRWQLISHPKPFDPKSVWDEYRYAENNLPEIIASRVAEVAEVDQLLTRRNCEIELIDGKYLRVTGDWVCHLEVMDILDRAAGLYMRRKIPEDAPVRDWLREELEKRAADE